ncbi:MAG: hypothetical protein KC496_10480, partial [Anaerolineae bacterium]|nr:hypothetical protein [Anaerolineae bacterium]
LKVIWPGKISSAQWKWRTVNRQETPMPTESDPQTVRLLEEERRRIAQEVDEQLLSQIQLLLAQAQTYEQTASGQSRTGFAVISSLIRQLLQQTLDFQANLHSSVLETLGLAPALEAFANQQRRRRGATITLALAPLRERLPYALESGLFRVVQACVGQMLSSGEASHILIQLAYVEQQLQLEMLANGIPLTELHLVEAEQQLQLLGAVMHIAQSRYGGAAVSIHMTLQPAIDLTEREREIIVLLADGLSNKQIAAALDIRPRTVKFHLDNLYSKLGVNTRTEAAIYALRQGWVNQVR